MEDRVKVSRGAEGRTGWEGQGGMNGIEPLLPLLVPRSLPSHTRAGEGRDAPPAAAEMWQRALRKQTPFAQEPGEPAINRVSVGPF